MLIFAFPSKELTLQKDMMSSNGDEIEDLV